MAYIRKTYDEWQLLGNYGFGWELLTSELKYSEIKQRKREYQENDYTVNALKIKCVRVAKGK